MHINISSQVESEDEATKIKLAEPNSASYRLGFGIGLRNVHFDTILKQEPKVDWFEAISENFMDSGGRPKAVLRWIAERYPVVLHGVSMSIGSTSPLDFTYLKRLRHLADEISARWVSDHLCWTGLLGINSHDLLPLPLNEIVLGHVIERVRQVQDVLERPLVLENPSTYIQFRESTISEPLFFKHLCAETGCKLLLDVNNVYVSCFNTGMDAYDYLADYPFDNVIQLHLAGHQHCGTHIIDTHDSPVCDEVWRLFQLAWQRTGGAATLLEWDGNIPDFAQVHAEILRARAFIDKDVSVSTTQTIQPPSNRHEISSTPVSFMIPAVMDQSILKPS